MGSYLEKAVGSFSLVTFYSKFTASLQLFLRMERLDEGSKERPSVQAGYCFVMSFEIYFGFEHIQERAL